MSRAGEKNVIIGGTLYIVATPVGNLSDISERAIKVLSGVDFIASEDTRNTGTLLSHYGISKPQISYYEHNKRERGESIVNRLERGESCALVTDAGTPAISDPGEDLVRLCAERGITVTGVPGACAAIDALTLSALPTRRFVFEGFLESGKKERLARLESLKDETRTTVIYEAPHRLRSTLRELCDVLGDRKISLCRELTKLNEEIIRTTLTRAIEYYDENEPRGEFVLVLDGAAEKKAEYPDDVTEHVNLLISEGLERMEAMKAAAKARGVSKSDVYREYTADR